MPENGGFEKEVRLFNFTNRIRIKQSELLQFLTIVLITVYFII